MQFCISLNSDQIYIRTNESKENGGFVFTLYRENGRDFVGIDGTEQHREICLKISDVLLEYMNRK